MATSIATGALKPKTAVTLAARSSIWSALSVGRGRGHGDQGRAEDPGHAMTGVLLPSVDANLGLLIIFAGLIGGIPVEPADLALRNPCRVRRTRCSAAWWARVWPPWVAGVNWNGLTQKILIPAVASSVIALPGGDLRNVAGVPDHPRHAAGTPGPWVPARTGRHRLAGRTRPRHQRRAEDHGRDRAGAVDHRAP